MTQGFIAYPLSPEVPSRSTMEAVLQALILSASGWRKVFAPDGDEESKSPELTAADRMLCAVIAAAFVAWLAGKTGKPAKSLCILLGTDTRPSGAGIAQIVARTFLSFGCKVHYTGVVAAPEIIASARPGSGDDIPDCHGFCYITASHNPIGHNGVKFGLSGAGVLGGDDATTLINLFKSMCLDEIGLARLNKAVIAVNEQKLAAMYNEETVFKKFAYQRYLEFCRMVFVDSTKSEATAAQLSTIGGAIAQRNYRIIAELNGSARCSSIDKEFLEGLGCHVKIVNGQPGVISHRIVPEGASLDECCHELEKAHKTDKNFVLGYVPDNDGDRGNVVYINQQTGKALVIEAQQLFALSVVAELSYMVYSGKLHYNAEGRSMEKVAVVVNDPTSMRISDIAAAFDANVFRAEVGEANVVELAGKLRKRGFIVRILGEGSNGGNITHPARVRDPLQSIGTILRLLSIRTTADTAGLFEIWCKHSGQKLPPEYELQDILASLPLWTTTSAYENDAKLAITTIDHAKLKAKYEDVFRRDWINKKEYLRNTYDIHSWEEINYEGINEFRGMGKNFRTGRERGGFKILFKNADGKSQAFLWMRGSGTEAVFRVAVDVKGNDKNVDQEFLNWHRAIVMEADKLASML